MSHDDERGLHSFGEQTTDIPLLWHTGSHEPNWAPRSDKWRQRRRNSIGGTRGWSIEPQHWSILASRQRRKVQTLKRQQNCSGLMLSKFPIQNFNLNSCLTIRCRSRWLCIWLPALNIRCTWLTPPTTRSRSLMTMEDAEHRGNVIEANGSHFFLRGWKASTVSSAEGSWPVRITTSASHQCRNSKNGKTERVGMGKLRCTQTSIGLGDRSISICNVIDTWSISMENTLNRNTIFKKYICCRHQTGLLLLLCGLHFKTTKAKLSSILDRVSIKRTSPLSVLWRVSHCIRIVQMTFQQVRVHFHCLVLPSPPATTMRPRSKAAAKSALLVFKGTVSSDFSHVPERGNRVGMMQHNFILTRHSVLKQKGQMLVLAFQ